MSGCCTNPCDGAPPRPGNHPDYLLWAGLTVCAAAVALHWAWPDTLASHPRLALFAHGVAQLLGLMWWGLAAGMVAVGLMSHVPREMVMAVLGPGGRFTGLLRATGAGLLLDACNHGILLVAAKLYERGASPGQVFAFLIASPWNSLSLTLVLAALVGWGWTAAFIAGSAAVALGAGALCELLVARGVLPPNPHHRALPADYHLGREVRQRLCGFRPDRGWLRQTILAGLAESRMVVRWILLGVILAALLRAWVPEDIYRDWFGPGLAGLFLTLLAATLIEVCSEGSTPIAADLLGRAGAPGGAFTFLMAGAATDLTEILVLRQATRSWKTALALPLLTVPQVLLLGWWMNRIGAAP